MVLENTFYCDLIVRRLSLFFIQKYPALGSAPIFDAIQDAFESYLNEQTKDIHDDIGQTIGWLWNAVNWNLSAYSTNRKRTSSMESIPHKSGDFDSYDDKETQFAITETLTILMSSLTEGEKDLVNLRMQEIPFEEIARLAGEKKNSVEKRHSRIIAKLANILRKDMSGNQSKSKKLYFPNAQTPKRPNAQTPKRPKSKRNE